MHFVRTKSPQNASCGRKCHLVPVYPFYSVFGALLILDSWWGALPLVPPDYAYAVCPQLSSSDRRANTSDNGTLDKHRKRTKQSAREPLALYPFRSIPKNRRHVKIDLTDLARRAFASFRPDYIVGGAEGYAAIIRVFGGIIVGDARSNWSRV